MCSNSSLPPMQNSTKKLPNLYSDLIPIYLQWKYSAQVKISFSFWLLFFFPYFLVSDHISEFCWRSTLARRTSFTLLQSQRTLILGYPPDLRSRSYSKIYTLWQVFPMYFLSVGTLSFTCFYFIPKYPACMWHMIFKTSKEFNKQWLNNWFTFLKRKFLLQISFLFKMVILTFSAPTNSSFWYLLELPDKKRHVAVICYAAPRLALISTLNKQPLHTLEKSKCEFHIPGQSNLPVRVTKITPPENLAVQLGSCVVTTVICTVRLSARTPWIQNAKFEKSVFNTLKFGNTKKNSIFLAREQLT